MFVFGKICDSNGKVQEKNEPKYAAIKNLGNGCYYSIKEFLYTGRHSYCYLNYLLI